jgi:hypothetical protein
MKTKSLESQVRECLIQQRADELVKSASENPNYKSMVIEIVETIGNSMIESMATNMGDVDEEERKEMLGSYREEFLPQIKEQITEQIDNPQQLRQLMEESARNQYLSYREMKAKLGSAFEGLRKLNESADLDETLMDETALQEFEKSFEGMFQYVKINDKIIRKLAKIAKEEGLEVATQKETGYNRVIREMFPTADDYKEFALRGIEDMRGFFQQAQSSLVSDGIEGKIMGSVICGMEKSVDKLMELGNAISNSYLEKTIKEVYG